ncbi:MAG: FAD-binding protein [Candidatus Eisenbacteria sp.]|nr:FAD-binding protein [Candidatus Eisenbacteria bacterium]
MLSRTLISRLRQITGPEGIIDGSEDLLIHSGDAVEAGAHTDVLVSPGTEEETAAVLALAAGEGIPVVPRGSGTGPSLASVAREGEIVLSSARMNQVHSVSAEDLIAVVGPGVKLEDLHRHALAAGLLYPVHAAIDRPATLGGTIGESTNGLRAVKYGGTRNYVMGMRIALPGGEVVQTGARTLKCVTGYDLARLFTGSLGTLGVCTRIFLKLLPIQETNVVTVAIFDRAREAAEASQRILEDGIRPSILELMDRTTLCAVAKTGNAPFPDDAGALLLIETDGLRVAADGQAERAGAICHASGAHQVRQAGTAHAVEAFMNARRRAFAALAGTAPAIVLEDVRVPRSKVADLVGSLRALLEIEGVAMAVFGHVGEGRLHPAIPVDPGDSEDVERARRIVEKISGEVRSLGGQLGPERGVGLGPRVFLERRIAPEKMEMARRLKETFDPVGIMNPRAVL